MPAFCCPKCKAVVQQRHPEPPDHCPFCGAEIRAAVHVADWIRDLDDRHGGLRPPDRRHPRPKSG